MRFSTIAASAALAAGVSATGNSTGDVYVTQVVSQYTTFCPASTTLTHEGKTYTITKATTIVLPCAGGCTITKPVVSAPASVPAPVKPTPAPEKSVPAPAPGKPTYAPAPAPSAGAPAPPSNGTAPTYKAPSGTAAASPSAFTGAANQAFAASGAGLAAVFGLAAYLL